MKGLTFGRYLSLENSAVLCICSTGFTSLNILLLFHLSITFFVFMQFLMLSDIDEVLSINPSTNVLVFGDFDVHHKDWLTYSGRTNRPGELCYNFPISNDLTLVVNLPTRISDL